MTPDAYATFLTARWDEIERAAKAVRPLETRYDMGGDPCPEKYTHGRFRVNTIDGRGNEAKDDPATPAHFDLHTPAFVLADLAAKRAILDLHRVNYGLGGRTSGCVICGGVDEYGHIENEGACETIIALAAPFRDHPDHPANQEA